MGFKEVLKKRLRYQGEKLEKRFSGRPYSMERYKRTMMVIAGFILAFFLFSVMCIIYTIGAWLQ